MIPPEPEMFPDFRFQLRPHPAARNLLIKGLLGVHRALTASVEAPARVLGMDVSRYQKCDYATLKGNGVSFLVAKATQGNYRKDATFRTHVDRAESVGMVPAAYHWDDPLYPDNSQAEYFLEAIQDSSAKFVWIDVEQYWQDWNEWLRAVQGKGKITKKIAPQRISESAYKLAAFVDQNSPLPVVIYTRTSFILDYARPMLEWLHLFPVCLAQYPYASGRLSVSWAQLKEHLPKIEPKLPAGIEKWLFWQFAGDKFIVPGCDTPADLVWFNGSISEFFDWVDQEPPPMSWAQALTAWARGQGYAGPEPEAV